MKNAPKLDESIFDGCDDGLESMSPAEMDAEFEAICDVLQKDAGDVNVRELFSLMARVGFTDEDFLRPLIELAEGTC